MRGDTGQGKDKDVTTEAVGKEMETQRPEAEGGCAHDRPLASPGSVALPPTSKHATVRAKFEFQTSKGNLQLCFAPALQALALSCSQRP